MNFQNLNLFILIIPIVAPFIISFGLFLYYRKKPKVDKGFKFNYYALSYRRKFWRTVYSIPLGIPPIVVIYLVLGFSRLFIFIILFFTLLFALQASFNYIMWKRELKH